MSLGFTLVAKILRVGLAIIFTLRIVDSSDYGLSL
jgi:hypothetical protein